MKAYRLETVVSNFVMRPTSLRSAGDCGVSRAHSTNREAK